LAPVPEQEVLTRLQRGLADRYAIERESVSDVWMIEGFD